MIDKVIANLLVKLGMSTTGFDKGVGDAESRLSKASQTMGKIGTMMTAAVTAPIIGAGVAITKMAMQFEQGMAYIYTLMDNATIKSKNWEKELKDLGKTSSQSMQVLQTGMYDIISSGIKAGDSIKVLTAANKAAIAGMGSTSDAARTLTAVINAYGLEAEDANDISDILFQTVNYGVITFPELANVVGEVISTAATANIKFEEVGGAIATMTLSGVDANEAVTSLNQLLLNFISPSEQAKEAAEKLGFNLDATQLSTNGLGDSLTELVEKLGISTDELIELEMEGQSESEIMDTMAFRAGLTSEQFASMFENVRALKGVLALTKNDGKDFNEMLERMKDRTGTTDAAFEKISQTAQHKFQVALNNVKIAATELGQSMLPIATSIFDKVTQVSQGFSGMSDASKTTVLAFAGIIAAAGPLISSAAGVIKIMDGVRLALKTPGIGVAGTFGIIAAAAALAGFAIYKMYEEYRWNIEKTEKKIYDLQTAEKGLLKTREALAMASLGDEYNKAKQSNFEADKEQTKAIFETADAYPFLQDRVVRITKAYYDAAKAIKVKNEQYAKEAFLGKTDNWQEFGAKEIKALADIEKQYSELGKEALQLNEDMKTHGIDSYSEALIRGKDAIDLYGEKIPEVNSLLNDWANDTKLGIMSQQEFSSKTQELIIDMSKYIDTLKTLAATDDESNKAKGRAKEIQDEIIEKYGLTSQQLEKLAEYTKEFTANTGESNAVLAMTGEIFGTTGKDSEELATSFGLLGLSAEDAQQKIKSLYDTVFSVTMAEDDLQEAMWATDDALKEFIKSSKGLKKDSREYLQLQNDLTDTYAAEYSAIGGVIGITPGYLQSHDQIQKAIGKDIAQLWLYGDVNEKEWKEAVSLLGVSKTEMEGILESLEGKYDKSVIAKLKEMNDETALRWSDVVSIINQNATVDIPESFAQMGISYDTFISGPLENWKNMTGKQWAEALRKIGLDKNEIDKILIDLGYNLAELGRIEVTPKVGLDTSVFYTRFNAVKRTINESGIGIGAALGIRPYTGGVVSELGKLQSFAGGGYTGNANSAYPAVLHPNEVIFNPQQQARLLFRMANEGGPGSNSITNVYNISELVVREEADFRRVAEELNDMQQDTLTGIGVKNA